MGNLKKGPLSSSEVIILSMLGSIASIAGLILTIIVVIRDKKKHRTKESNRQPMD